MRNSRTVCVGSLAERALMTLVRRRAGLFVFACVATGCSFGMTAAKYPPALGPQGVSLQLDIGERQMSGELIEVRESGMVILTPAPVTPSSSSARPGGASSQALDQGRLQFVAYGAIHSWEVDGSSKWIAVIEQRAPDRNAREQLRLLSRFPQGLTADLLKLLLTAHGQTELPGVTP